MIVVKVELWPNGLEHKRYEIARMEVANVGGSLANGDYSVDVPGGRDWNERSGSVLAHDRSLPIWRLVAKALAATGFGGGK
jgi:hypothetical protein